MFLCYTNYDYNYKGDKMVDYYKVLNLGLCKKQGLITDELVKQHYESLKKQYYKFYQNAEELQENLDILNDAYSAIKTEDSRKYYDELVNEINEYLQQKQKREMGLNHSEKITKLAEYTNSKQKTKRLDPILISRGQWRKDMSKDETEDVERG